MSDSCDVCGAESPPYTHLYRPDGTDECYCDECVPDRLKRLLIGFEPLNTHMSDQVG